MHAYSLPHRSMSVKDKKDGDAPYHNGFAVQGSGYWLVKINSTAATEHCESNRISFFLVLLRQHGSSTKHSTTMVAQLDLYEVKLLLGPSNT